MAKAFTIPVEPRESRGRSEIRKLRADGFLPAVIYGKGIDTQALSIPRQDLIRALHSHGMHALVSLEMNGKEEYLALIREVQIDPVRQEALHIDFERVEADKPVHTEVEVEIVGTPAGVKEGGILEVPTRSVAIEALPLAIPDNLTYDASHMEIGDVARVGDLQAPEGVTILADAEETLCTVAAPRVEEEGPTLSAEDIAALTALSDEEREALVAMAAEVAEAEEEEAAEGEAPAEGEDTEGEEASE